MKSGDDIVDKSVLRIVTANPQVCHLGMLMISHFVTMLLPPVHAVFCCTKRLTILITILGGGHSKVCIRDMLQHE